jgi:hypothetical protein
MKVNKLKRHPNTIYLKLCLWKERKNIIKRMWLDHPSNTLTVSLLKTNQDII